MKSVYFPLIAVLGLSSSPLLAQSCNNKLNASTPAERFLDNHNGTVTDKLTGLRWARCSLGQKVDNGRCRGEAHQLPWAIVSLVIEKGWRLPDIAELNSLVELRCIRPAINTMLFPDTIPAAYWSATRFINTDGNYWQVNFLHGESTSEPSDAAAYVRLVQEEP
jgi:hypothetical protein